MQVALFAVIVVACCSSFMGVVAAPYGYARPLRVPLPYGTHPGGVPVTAPYVQPAYVAPVIVSAADDARVAHVDIHDALTVEYVAVYHNGFNAVVHRELAGRVINFGHVASAILHH